MNHPSAFASAAHSPNLTAKANIHRISDLDLGQLDHGGRAAAWVAWHDSAFDRRVVSSDALSDALEGHAWQRHVAGARLYRIKPAFARLQIGSEERASDTGSGVFTAAVQLSGHTEIMSRHGSIELHPGDVAFMCCRSLEKRISSGSELLLLQAPSVLVRARQPIAGDSACFRLDPTDPSRALIRNALIHAFDVCAALSVAQQNHLLISLLELLGMPCIQPSVHGAGRDQQRVEQALQQIRSRLSDPDFDAPSLADSMFISRRRLDKLFVIKTGTPVARCILEHRLKSAGDALRDPAHQTRTVTDIALSHGFESVSHFARSFKKHFGVTALEWRSRASGPP